jgi:PAS domain S-box-containing protein
MIFYPRDDKQMNYQKTYDSPEQSLNSPVNPRESGNRGLEQQIQRFQQRFEAIRQNAENASIPSQNLLAETITELGITLEELYQQNAELLATREDLAAERQRYQILFELAPDGYLVTDAKGVIQEANCASEILLNVPRSLLVGKPLVVFVSPEDRPFFRTQLTQIGTSAVQDMGWTDKHMDKEQAWEIGIQPREGTAFPAAVSVSARFALESKKIGSIHWLIRDVNERLQAEEALRQAHDDLKQLQESEERFRHAFDNAVAGIALVALDGRWLKVNPALCQLLGYSEEELLRLDSQSLTHKNDLEQFHHTIRQLLTGEIASSQIEKRFLHKQGHFVWMISGMSLVRDEQGKPLYFVKQIQDITERRTIEEIKSEFISVVSHELRTPLAAIRGSLGLLAAGVLDDEPHTTKQMLGIAAHEAERLVRLVNDILDLERFEANKVVLDKQWYDATTLMQQAAEVIKPLAEESKITVSLVPYTQSVPVWAAPDRLMQVLVNLLSNAIKFSPRESTVTLTVQNQVDRVLFQVKDQGRGIPADKVETIFGRFQQVDGSDARDKGGTGLGLTICRNIVQKHGGHIWVESALGKGSTFYFTLPIPLE